MRFTTLPTHEPERCLRIQTDIRDFDQIDNFLHQCGFVRFRMSQYETRIDAYYELGWIGACN